MAMMIRRAPTVENTVTGSLSTITEATTATTISDKSRMVEVEAERYLSPSSQK
jgi:hypothetical protein